MDKNIENLVGYAIQARKRAYAIYSKFMVGAAIECDDGSIYTGCNIENASYPVGICAERVAISKAVSDGKVRIRRIAVVGGRIDKPIAKTMPCGMCRQFLAEFADNRTEIILAGYEGGSLRYYFYRMEDLFPGAFNLNKFDTSPNAL